MSLKDDARLGQAHPVTNPTIIAEVDGFIRKNQQNTLLDIPGHRFASEESVCYWIKNWFGRQLTSFSKNGIDLSYWNKCINSFEVINVLFKFLSSDLFLFDSPLYIMGVYECYYTCTYISIIRFISMKEPDLFFRLCSQKNICIYA